MLLERQPQRSSRWTDELGQRIDSSSTWATVPKGPLTLTAAYRTRMYDLRMDYGYWGRLLGVNSLSQAGD